MTADEGWFAGHLRDLDTDECHDLLTRGRVGRVAWNDPQEGPTVLPVNYRWTDGSVVFRTSPHSALARHFAEGPVAFEIDDVDEFDQVGWSVLVRGTARALDPDELPAPDERPRPWVEGSRAFFVQVCADRVTGRRILPA
ncbi:MAG: pyridoxamine 5'-phosphate oxidase family protein [Nocardioides sp.]